MTTRGGDCASSPIITELRRPRVESSGSFALEQNAVLKTKLIPQDPAAPTAPVTTPAETKTKSIKDLWYLHGEFYDLTDFVASHPGGPTILKLTKGMEDATPVMESYHAFANKEYIRKTLSKYKVNYVPYDINEQVKPNVKYTFEKDGFYETLTRRVRAHFGGTKDNESVTAKVKANKWWTFKVISQTFLFAGLFGAAFFLPGLNTLQSVICSATAGMMLIAVGMNAMHDASHYAIGTRDSWKNRLTMRIWNSIALWQSDLWYLHHTINHHAYTGDTRLDPDTMHANPAVRKHTESPKVDYFMTPFHIPFLRASRLMWTAWAIIIYVFFPGMFTMQIFSYHFLWKLRGSLWNMPLDRTKDAFKKYWFETFLSLAVLAAHLYKANIWTSLAFYIGTNLTYAVTIVPDHDTYETVILNHKSAETMDWGEMQARNASDFGGKGTLGRAFTEMFGSINVQIGHHLFPSVNHVYLPEIAPIIRQTCAEFGIPYAQQPSIPAAMWSFMKTVYRCNGPESDQDLVVPDPKKQQ